MSESTVLGLIAPQIPVKLALKLAAALGEIPEVPKLGHHETQNYPFARAADIAAAARVVLSKHHVFLLWRPDPEFFWREFQSTRTNSMMREVTIWFDLTLIDADSGESVTVRWPGVAADMVTSDKVIVKAQTAALKTFLVMQFQIPSDEGDSDRTAETEDTRKSRQQPNWPKQVHGPVQEVEQKADGWMVNIRGIHYWTKVRQFALQLTAARGKDVDISADIGKGPDNERCPVITKILNAPPATAAPASTTANASAAPPKAEQTNTPAQSKAGVIPKKEEVFP